MATVERIVVALMVLTAAALATACSGDEGTDTRAGEAAEMRATLTDDGCSYEGGTAPAGRFTVEVENRSSKNGAFALGALAAGSTLEDLEDYVADERRRIEVGREIAGPPAFYSQDVRVAADPGGTTVLPADVGPGTYALTCFNDPPLTAIYVATQLDVRD